MNIWPRPRLAKSAIHSAGWKWWRSPPACAHGYSFDFLAPEKISAAKVRSVLESFG
jgi:hypothetical protein